MKYRVDEPISTIMGTIIDEVHQVDHVIKNKLSSYHHAKSNLNLLNRKKAYSQILNINGLFIFIYLFITFL